MEAMYLLCMEESEGSKDAITPIGINMMYFIRRINHHEV